jgi:hypothetical protein
MQHQVGRITFGPQQSAEEAARRRREAEEFYRSFRVTQNDLGPRVHACSCVGPQPGETKCPCELRGEAEQGRQMVREGVVINGVEYDLVPRKAKG